MAIAGDMNHIPSFPVSLGPGNRIQVHARSTNKPRHLVERDIEVAARRLLDGERFELHCSGPQVMQVQALIDEALPSYPAQRAGNEPPAAATIRQQVVGQKALLAQAAGDERQAAKREVYRLSGEWWRAVRR